MDDMATNTAADNEAQVSDTFTLQVVSPSVGFNGPVSFPDLPAATTVQQLKAKIREKVQTRPDDDHQRLIHRGRLLRAAETMSDVFGQETLRNAKSQTVHLVLRPVAQQDPPSNTSSSQPSTSQQNSQTQPAPHPILQPPTTWSTLPPPPVIPRFTHTPVPILQQLGQIGASANQPQLNFTQQPTSAGTPTVYILSSPSGPRALLLTNGSTFFTPRPTPTISLPYVHPAHTPPQPGQSIPQPHQAQPHLHQVHHHHNHYAAQHPHPHPPPGQVQPDGPVLLGHQGNPAAAGALVVQLAPHIWLVIRLLGFIWFFTSGNTSWWRWSMITGLSVIFFLANTGLVNWAPIRRHLENLIPLRPRVNADGAAPDGQPAPAGLRVAAGAGAGAETGTGAGTGDLDPQRVADRLVEQRRRADAGWFVAQMRRAEHAVLLFLASLWPGVGERHVAAREEEEQARRRREEAAEAERIAAQEAAQAAAGEGAEAGSEEKPEVDGREAAEGSDKPMEEGGSQERELSEFKDETGEGSGEADTPKQSTGLGGHERQEQLLINV